MLKLHFQGGNHNVVRWEGFLELDINNFEFFKSLN